MKKIFLFLFSLLVGVVLFIWIVQWVGLEEIKLAFLTFSAPGGLIILGLTGLIWLIGLWRWKEILKSQNLDISFKNLWQSYFAAIGIMFFAPILIIGGEMFRSYILKEKNLAPWPKAMTSVIIDRITEMVIYSTIIIFGIFFFLFKIGLPPKNLLIILAGFLIFFIGGIIFFYFKKETIFKIFYKLGRENHIQEIVKEIFAFFKLKNGSMWKGVGLSFLKSACGLLRTWLLILFLGKNIGILSTLSILGFNYLAMMIPIPAALGSHDAIQAFAFDSFGVGASSGAVFAMIVRGTEMIIALIGIIILIHLGLTLLKKFILKKAEKFAINNKNEKFLSENRSPTLSAC